METEGWVLSIDGGGTKTDLLLVDPGKLRGFFKTGGGTNPNVYGDHALSVLDCLLGDVVGYLDPDEESIDECIVGMAGISHPEYRPRIENKISSVLSGASLKLTSDAELAHRSIWGNSPGITLIVGTGSIALRTDREGALRRSGGFGYQVGDEGSGYWLGKSLLAELIVAERSEGGDVLQLMDTVQESSGKSTFEEAIAFFSAGEKSIARVAGLAIYVLSFAERGNVVATQIVYRGVEALGALIGELSEKLNGNATDVEIGISGSLISKSRYYRNMLEDELLLQFDSVKWVTSGFPPVFGGLVLSRNGILPDEFGRISIDHVQACC